MFTNLKLSVNVHIRQFSAEGDLIDEEWVHNLVTDVGCAHIADQLASSHDEDEMSHMAVGTGTDAAAAGDTALQTQVSREALTSRTQGSGGDDHTVTYSASFTGIAAAVTEAGIFNAASSGVLLARSVFAAKNMATDETLVIDWELSVADDGS